MAARIVAILVALGMVGGAVAYRLNAASDGGGSGGGGSSGPVAVVCATELGAACTALAGQVDGVDVTVERAADTASRLIGADSGAEVELDGWLTPGPWPAMVDEARRAAGRSALFDDLGDPIARSPLLLVARDDAGSGEQCLGDGPVEWKCVGDAAGAGFRLSGPASGEATAILHYGALAGSYLGTIDYGTNDLTGEAVQWLHVVEQQISATRSGQATSLAKFLVAPAVAEAFLTTEAEWAKATFGAANVSAFGAFVLAPAATADLHLGLRSGSGRAERLAELFEDDPALELVRQQGWRVPGRPSIAGVVPDLKLQDTNGLPSAGVLQGLREVVQ